MYPPRGQQTRPAGRPADPWGPAQHGGGGDRRTGGSEAADFPPVGRRREGPPETSALAPSSYVRADLDPNGPSWGPTESEVRVPGYLPTKLAELPYNRTRARINTPADGRDSTVRGLPIPSDIRRTLHRIRKGIAPLSRPRIRACGYAPCSSTIGVILGQEGRARYAGLQTCASIWECPVCTARIKATRAAEVTYCIESHGRERCAMLTLTIRHGAGDDLRRLGEKLADCWRAFTRGEPWARCKGRLGIWHSLRALEVTHGHESGFHPHLHCLIFLRDAIHESEIHEVDGVERWLPQGPNGIGWIIERWIECVRRTFGEDHVPDETHGVLLAPLHRDDYLSKLGLEVSDPGHKRGRHENRTPLEIADDFAKHRIASDGAIWRAYCAGMKGRKQLTWSAGCKRAFGIRDRSDLEVCHDEDASPSDVLVGTMHLEAWSDIRGRRALDGTPLPVRLLEAAEQGGHEGFQRALLLAACGEL